MTKTQNYQLPQWVKEDRIMMDDFNEAMGNIEKGITAAKDAAVSAGNAAAAAQNTANAAKDLFKIGTYTGNGSTSSRSFNVGFRPQMVIISGQGYSRSATDKAFARFGLLTSGQSRGFGVITDTGFAVSASENAPVPSVNETDIQYTYIAFR